MSRGDYRDELFGKRPFPDDPAPSTDDVAMECVRTGAPDEIRVTDPRTGGQKGSKPQRLSFVPLDLILRYVAPHYVKGAEKYARDNWRKGYDWSLSFDAMQRHLAAFWYERQSLDPETGTHHLAAVVFHALALLWFQQERPGLDDRPSIGDPAKVD